MYKIPTNYDELYRRYDRTIHNVLSHRVRDRDQLEELYGHVWCKLLDAHLLERFHTMVNRVSIPLPIVLQALGIDWVEWSMGLMLEWETNPAPHPFSRDKPVASTWLQEQTIWKIKHPELLERFQPIVCTEERFVNYLKVAVRRHHMNWCRTQFRRHKERVQAPYEDGSSWESKLPSNVIKVDEALWAKDRFQRALRLARLPDDVIDTVDNGRTLKSLGFDAKRLRVQLLSA